MNTLIDKGSQISYKGEKGLKKIKHSVYRTNLENTTLTLANGYKIKITKSFIIPCTIAKQDGETKFFHIPNLEAEAILGVADIAERKIPWTNLFKEETDLTAKYQEEP